MIIISNLDKYRRIQQRRINKLLKIKRKGPINASKFMAAQLRRLAPRRSGNLINTIHRRKNSVSVGGTSKDGFPYVHWINATPGFGLEKVRLARRPTRFGKWPRKSTRDRNLNKWTKLMSYEDCMNKTGTPRFFFVAENLTRKHFRDGLIRDTRRALRARF